MSWVIDNLKRAEMAGADPDYDRAILAVTPNYVAEHYNNVMAEQTSDTQGDHWGELAPESQKTLLDAVDAYCLREYTRIDEELTSIFAQLPDGH